MSDDELAEALERLLLSGDDSIAREHLSSGHAIYLTEDDTPIGYVVRLNPDGRRELVSFDEQGEPVVRLAA